MNSERAVRFRKWATVIIKDYTIKGYAMDDERLKNDGSILGKKYFEEQLQRIREIRLSERKFYQKITEDMAQRNMPMTMADWEERLNRFIAATDRAILQDAGKNTAEIAKAHAEREFEKYRIVQDRLYVSDFDKQILALTAPDNVAMTQGEQATDIPKLTVQKQAPFSPMHTNPQRKFLTFRQ